MAHYPGDVAGGPASRDSMPACTKSYHPNTGGYKGDSIESAGDPGEKESAGAAPQGGKSDDGDHQTKVNSFGNYPHGSMYPEGLTPIGSMPEDPTRATP